MVQTMINVYTTSHRRKARQELRMAQIKPYTPKEFGGLIAANDKPREANYVHSLIGRVRRDEFARMCARTSKTQRRYKFSTGDQITIKRGHHATLPGTVLGVCGGGWYEIAASLFGRVFHVKMRESDISHHTHPHIK